MGGILFMLLIVELLWLIIFWPVALVFPIFASVTVGVVSIFGLKRKSRRGALVKWGVPEKARRQATRGNRTRCNRAVDEFSLPI